jgi:hypothetical protein
MKWRFLGLVSLAVMACAICGGCARAPAGNGVGPRLVVTLRFNPTNTGGINPLYYYYFLIRNAPDTEGINPTNGPIPVVLAPYAGNGFATDLHPGGGTAAFTDFVLFGGGGQPTSSGYGFYHVAGYLHGDPNNPTTFRLRGDPDFAARPTTTDPNTLTFELSLSRLRADTGECDATKPGDCPTARFLTINVVATTKLPSDPQQTDPQKFTDAFGDQSSLLAPTFNNPITIDTSQVGTVYQSTTSPGDRFYEPDNDTFPARSDPAIELVAWQIQVRS